MRVTTKNNKKEHYAEKPSEKELRVKTTGQYCHMLRKIQVKIHTEISISLGSFYLFPF